MSSVGAVKAGACGRKGGFSLCSQLAGSHWRFPTGAAVTTCVFQKMALAAGGCWMVNGLLGGQEGRQETQERTGDIGHPVFDAEPTEGEGPGEPSGILEA